MSARGKPACSGGLSQPGGNSARISDCLAYLQPVTLCNMQCLLLVSLPFYSL